MVKTPITSSLCSFSIAGIQIQALRWQNERYTTPKNPVIALHGWLDNAASFGLLAPLLVDQNPELDIVALDLAGHGLSDFRPGLSAYNIWQDLSEIYQIVQQLGWNHFSIIGHSRGAMIATLYAGAFREQIDGLCLIDAITPKTTAAADLPKQLRSSIKQLSRVNDKTTTYYSTYEEAVKARTQGMYPLTECGSKLLAGRGVVEDKQHGFYWRYDRCLLAASEIRFTDEQVAAFVNVFPVQALVLLADDGLVYDYLKDSQENKVGFVEIINHQNLRIVNIPGDHHLQLSDDDHTLNLLVTNINDYLSSD